MDLKFSHVDIIVEDLELKKNRPKLVMVTELATCGRLVVPKGARVVAETVSAGEGLVVKGHLEAKDVHCGRAVLIGKKAYWRGRLQASTLVVEDTAVIERAFFDVEGSAGSDQAERVE